MVFYTDLKGQSWLFPPNIQDMIPDDHICHLVDAVVDSMDLKELESEYEGPGHPAYHPRIVLKLLLMSSIDGIRSSRKISRLARENVVYMYLAGNLKPDFRTICDFRKEHPDVVSTAFKEVVRFAHGVGMVRLGHMSIDGTKVKASASNSKIISKKDLAELERFIKEEMERGAEEDEREDALYGKDKTGYEMPVDRKKIVSKLKERFKKGDEKQREKISKLVEKARTEAKQVEKGVASITDPESRFMKGAKGFSLSYNVQITADSSHGIIVANDVTQEVVDNNQLKPQVEQAKENLGVNLSGTEMSADSGYFSIGNIAYLAENGIDGYIPSAELAAEMKGGRRKSDVYPKEMFRYDGERDCFVCPEGKCLAFRHEYFDKRKNEMIKIYHAGRAVCRQCPSKLHCTKDKNGRAIKSLGHEMLRIALAQKMRSSIGKEKYGLRKQVETPFGNIKQNLGLREFLCRGIKPVKTEFNLACTAHNLKRIWSYLKTEVHAWSRVRGLFFRCVERASSSLS